MTRAAPLAMLLSACSPTVPGYGARADVPWPLDDVAAVDDVLVQRWPLHLTPDVHAADVAQALGPPLVVHCVTDERDYPARTVAGHTRVAGQYLPATQTIPLACGYDTVGESAYAQEAIHRVLHTLGRDPYLTEQGTDVGSEDEPLREALTQLETEARR